VAGTVDTGASEPQVAVTARSSAVDAAAALLEVQRLDLVLDELAEQGANFPHKTKVAQIAQKAAEGKSLVEKLEAGIVKFEAQIAKIEKNIVDLRDKIEREQAKIDAGQIDYRQVAALSADISALNDRINNAESEQLKIMEARQEAKKRIADVQVKISELEGAKEQTLQAYRQQMAILASKTVQITAARDEKRELISPEVRESYDTQRDQRGGNVVGLFDGTRCSACSLAIPTAFIDQLTSPGDIGTCSECHRILVCLGEQHDE